MTPSCISRATKALQHKGWLIIHYIDGNKRRRVENYELRIPITVEAERLSHVEKRNVESEHPKRLVTEPEWLNSTDWSSVYDLYSEPETMSPLLEAEFEENDFA